MPNWSANTLIVKGKSSDIKKMFKDLDGYKENMNLDEFRSFIWDHAKDLTMRSWFPMPQTYVDYDTTNSKYNRDSKKVVSYDGQTGQYITTDRFNSDEEYDEYSKNYDEAIKYQKETYGLVGWYDYNYATLGTKWDAMLQDYNHATIDEDGETMTIQFNFETAWNSPTPWLDSMIEKYPDFDWSLESHDEGDFFNFIIEYDKDTKEFKRTELPSELIDDEFDDDEEVEADDLIS